VPLQFEAGYKPRGWLGVLIGARPYVNFSNPSNLKDKVGQLVDQLKKILNKDHAGMHVQLPKLFEYRYYFSVNYIDISEFCVTCQLFYISKIVLASLL